MYLNPYENLSGGRWIKVNLHTHAGTGDFTCGKWPIDFVLDLYEKLGYGAVCLSNHDRYIDVKNIKRAKPLVIPGVEYSREPHMLTVGVTESLHELNHQDAINETKARGGFTVLCHPNWIHKEYWPLEKMLSLSGYAGIEVMNALINRLSGSGVATDLWDKILSSGRLVYGFGSDDFHMPFDAGRCFTHVYVYGNGFGEIKKAVDCGRFTASTGIGLSYLKIDGDTINVKVKFLTKTYVDSFNYKFITENGASEVYGKTASFKIAGEKYVRVEATAENGAKLFTQPVWRTPKGKTHE